MKKWVIVLWLFAHSVFAGELITKVIELHYQNAASMIDLIDPILQKGEAISGSGQTLILKVQPQTLTQIRTILHKVDVPPVTFEISIYQGNPDWLATQNSNSEVISTGAPPTQPLYQSVTVNNGESAFVTTNLDQPVVSSAGTDLLTGPSVSYQRKVSRVGFYIEPTMQGKQVRLSIKRVRQQNAPSYGQEFLGQETKTVIMTPVDKWVAVSSAEGGPPAKKNSNVIHAGSQFQTTATIYVKVNVRKN